MGDYYNPDLDDLPDVDICKQRTPWVWIILFIFACLVIVGLVGWLIWTYVRKSQTKGKEITLLNPSIVVSNTQITATWTNSDATKGNIYNLYATTNPPRLGPTGTILNSSPFRGNEVTGDSSNSAQVSGLIQNTKYYATLVVTNKGANNYQVFTQLVFMSAAAPAAGLAGGTVGTVDNFTIEHILQGGSLQITSADAVGGVYSVEYNSDSACERSVFFMNTRGQIQSSAPNLGDICLFNENSHLVAKSCSGTDTSTAAGLLANSQWVYNPQGSANKWCLGSTVGTTTGTSGPTCMIMGTLNATSRTTTVSVGSTAQAGDAWANYFRSPFAT